MLFLYLGRVLLLHLLVASRLQLPNMWEFRGYNHLNRPIKLKRSLTMRRYVRGR